MPRKSKILRQARIIKVKGGDEVYTRLSKREYEIRREMFDDPDFGVAPEHLSGFSYDDWTEFGAEGGRPRKWKSDAERMRAKRAKEKLAKGQSLTSEEKELLGLISKRPGAYQSSLGRAMTPAERKEKWKESQRLKKIIGSVN